jgi:uncharacterized protein (DUF885 family)
MTGVSLRRFVGLVVVGCFALGPLSVRAQIGAPASADASVAARSKALSTLFADIWQDRLKHSPEFASLIGDKRYNDQLTDYSAREVNASLQRGLDYIQRLGAIDTTGLTDQEKLSSELMLHSLIDDQQGAKFKEWEMPISPIFGFQTRLADLVGQLSFDSVKDYDDYIARLKKVPAQFSQVMTNLQLGVDEGRMPPKDSLEKALAQTQGIADQKPEESVFAEPLKKFPKMIPAADQKRIAADLMAVIQTQVLPTYQRFAKYMKVQYVSYGRKDPGVWAMPNGDAYYAFRIRQITTMDKTADQIHQIGLDEVKKDEAEMLAIVHQLGFTDLKSFRTALAANPKEHPQSAEALMHAYKGYIAQMQPKLPELFGRLPKAPLEVVAMPSFAEKNSPMAYYNQGTADGSRPGRVNVNLYNFAERSLVTVESVAYHEGIPGHHLQISIAQETTGLPEFRKYQDYTAFVEGWALYSERLGKEIGFYKDPYSDYGRLDNDMWRAIRLVVDTGVHSQHWTRQQMVDYFHDHSSLDETNVQAEVDRYIAWPAQALGYKMGQLKILELRDKAKTALGPKFDLKAFHDVVLDSGALPMDVLEQRVDAWIASQTTSQTAAQKK